MWHLLDVKSCYDDYDGGDDYEDDDKEESVESRRKSYISVYREACLQRAPRSCIREDLF
jgi:hypothetical protein